MNPNIYKTLLNEENNIEKLYKHLNIKYNCKRNKKIYINDQFGTIYTGMKSSQININILQNWVDKFHSYIFNNYIEKMLTGFILYLLYERIHPHSDGNGRMGRYLFLENKLLLGINNCLPLSKILNDCLELPVKYMNEIFEWLDTTVNIESNEKDYYKLKIPLKILKKIFYIIYISICYKYFISIDKKHIKLFKKFDDFKYIFCICKAKHDVGKSTELYITEKHKLLNIKFANKINEFIDFEIHKKYIKEFGIMY